MRVKSSIIKDVGTFAGSSRRKADDESPIGPVGFVLDSDRAIRATVATALAAYGIRPEEFGNLPDMMTVATLSEPVIVIVDPGVSGAAAVAVIEELARAKLKCPIQLLTAFNALSIEDARRAGSCAGLTMLPVVHKPFPNASIRQILRKAGLKPGITGHASVDLGEAIGKRWLEVWYQPKIDLRTKLMEGAEAFIRCRHPEHGIILPETFVAEAGEDDLLSLAQFVLVRALHDWRDFVNVGDRLKFSVNMPMVAMVRLPLATILRNERPYAPEWPGIILELKEDEAIRDLELSRAMAKKLERYHAELALDDFGASFAVVSQLKNVPFCEFKIDCSFIKDCDSDTNNSGFCETVIELAHRFGVQATAEGIETPAELATLQGLRCDFGQGDLFARPLSKPQFADLLRNQRPHQG